MLWGRYPRGRLCAPRLPRAHARALSDEWRRSLRWGSNGGSCVTRVSVERCSGAGTPEAGFALLGFLAQSLELAAVGVGEGGRAGQPQSQEILVEEVLVGAVLVRVEVDVGESATVRVLGVAYAWDLQPDQPLRQGLLRVGAGLLTVAAYRLVRRHGLGRVNPDETDRP